MTRHLHRSQSDSIVDPAIRSCSGYPTPIPARPECSAANDSQAIDASERTSHRQKASCCQRPVDERLHDDDHDETPGSDTGGSRVVAETADVSRATAYRRLNDLRDAGLVCTEMMICEDGHHKERFKPVATSISDPGTTESRPCSRWRTDSAVHRSNLNTTTGCRLRDRSIVAREKRLCRNPLPKWPDGLREKDEICIPRLPRLAESALIASGYRVM